MLTCRCAERPSCLRWQVKLKHVETGVFLASSERKYGRPISGQQEVCGRKKADWWAATEGVYFTERGAEA